jgi:hypothetical protein
MLDLAGVRLLSQIFLACVQFGSIDTIDRRELREKSLEDYPQFPCRCLKLHERERLMAVPHH